MTSTASPAADTGLPSIKDLTRSLINAGHDVVPAAILMEYVIEGTISGISCLAERVVKAAPDLAGYRIFVLTREEFDAIHCATKVVRDRAQAAFDAAEELEAAHMREGAKA